MLLPCWRQELEAAAMALAAVTELMPKLILGSSLILKGDA